MIKLLLFVLGLVLLALAFFTNLIPSGDIFGLSYEILSIILGTLLVLFAFVLWRRSRRIPGDLAGMNKHQMRRAMETGRLRKDLMKGYA